MHELPRGVYFLSYHREQPPISNNMLTTTKFNRTSSMTKHPTLQTDCKKDLFACEKWYLHQENSSQLELYFPVVLIWKGLGTEVTNLLVLFCNSL